MGPMDPVTITEILFTTSQDAGHLMDEPVGKPDGAIVCCVELRGKPTGKATFLPIGTPVRHSETEATIRVVFDAHTNELGFGVS
jgi:hypothetical protein